MGYLTLRNFSIWTPISTPETFCSYSWSPRAHSDDSGGLLKVREVKLQNIEILIFYCFYQ